jgi:hypothetical protein|tara:strand:- start:4425 stop:6815 length:2391 start_codon:yes stop_codon:yes gene_type:complete
MALIDLNTNLRSLKFGLGQASDKPGGGYSNQPYIVKPIPDYDDDGSNIFNTGGPDSLLRGGLMAPIKSIDDVSRLTQMFFDLKSPNGLLFTVKQNVLSRTSVKTEASRGAGTAGGTVNQGVYLPTSTIAQAGVGFTGTHLNLLGLNPFSPGLDNNSLTSQLSNGGLVKYETAARVANEADNNVFSIAAETISERNPLFDLFTTQPLLLGSEASVGANPFQEFIQTLIPGVNGSFDNRLLKIWYDKQDTKNEDVNVLEYGGGPGSILGIGKTRIKFADQRTGVNNPNYLGNSLPNQDLQDFRDTTRQVYYQASNLAISASVLNIANMDFKVNRGPEKSNALTRTQNELQEALGKIPIDTTSSYFTTITSSNFTQSNHEFLSEDRTADLDAGQALSPFTINNNLIDEVVAAGDISTYASSKNSIPPAITYAAKLLSDSGSKGATIDYNNLISRIPNSTPLPIDGYLNANSFNVYDTVSGSNSSWPNNSPLQYLNNSSTWTQTQIIEEPSNTEKLIGSPTIQDFRRNLIGTPSNPTVGSSTIMSLAPDYNGSNRKNLEYRVSAGDPGKSKNRLKYSVSDTALDKINARMPYDNSVPKDSRVDYGNDFCKFSIGILKNDGTGDSTYIHFRAFINSFDDKYSADWGSTQYVGRADKFHNYKGFDRSISMGWTVYAQSKAELAPMYKKLNLLASSLAPTYSPGGFMQGNLARLTVGGYLYNQLGIIKSISYTIPQESTWEIGISETGGYDSSVKELPHMINVTGFDFVPIENTVPQYGLTRFINLKRGMSETDPEINLYARD